jgi:hypothetical protein
MLQSDLVKSISEWSSASKTELKGDLAKLGSVPMEVLRSISDRIAKTYPCCSPAELAILESERRGESDGRTLADVASLLGFIFDKADNDEPGDIVSDLVSLELLPEALAPTLLSLVQAAQPLRTSANAAAANIRLGTSLFVTLRGTVDIRLRFNKSAEEIEVGSAPVGLMDAQRLVFANLTINRLNAENEVIPFVMDEADLQYMKRFVRNMEAALELSKKVRVETEDNG